MHSKQIQRLSRNSLDTGGGKMWSLCDYSVIRSVLGRCKLADCWLLQFFPSPTDKSINQIFPTTCQKACVCPLADIWENTRLLSIPMVCHLCLKEWFQTFMENIISCCYTVLQKSPLHQFICETEFHLERRLGHRTASKHNLQSPRSNSDNQHLLLYTAAHSFGASTNVRRPVAFFINSGITFKALGCHIGHRHILWLHCVALHENTLLILDPLQQEPCLILSILPPVSFPNSSMANEEWWSSNYKEPHSNPNSATGDITVDLS